MSERVIPIAAIEVGQRLRALDPAWVDFLAEEIGDDGQRDAIRVVARGEGFVLIDGARRIAALAKLGRDTIMARVDPEEALADAAFVRLGEIKGNMLRAGLTVLDRAYCIAAWREVYESAHPPQKRGPRPASGIGVRLTNNSGDIARSANDEAVEHFRLSFSEVAQEALKLSQKGVYRALTIARIEPALGHRLTGHPCADNQSALLRLAEETPERQLQIVDLLLNGQATTVTEAIANLEPQKLIIDPAESAYQIFSRFSDQQKSVFFDMNADGIEKWLAQREAEQIRLKTEQARRDAELKAERQRAFRIVR